MRLVLFLICSQAGCGGLVQGIGDTPDSSATETSDAFVGGEAESPAPADLLKPPAKSGKSATGKTKWFAMNALKLGISTRADVVKYHAWKDYGFDLDNRATTKEQSARATFDSFGSNSCLRRGGSTSAQLFDGPMGLDNNFGQFVMPLIKSLTLDAEDRFNNYIKGGEFTWVLKIDNFTSEDNDSTPGSFYVANGLGPDKFRPKFDESDSWPINAASLVDGKTLSSPKVSFPKGYISKGIWVSGELGTDIQLDILLPGSIISLPIDSSIVTMRTDGSFGTIAGAMHTKSFEGKLAPFARQVGICPETTAYRQLTEAIVQSADLVRGAPSLQDTSKECDAISIGLGFNAKTTGVPTKIYTMPMTLPDPVECVSSK